MNGVAVRRIVEYMHLPSKLHTQFCITPKVLNPATHTNHLLQAQYMCFRARVIIYHTREHRKRQHDRYGRIAERYGTISVRQVLI